MSSDSILTRISNRSKHVIDDTDVSRCDQFVRSCVGDVIYCSQLGWLAWDGKRFKKDPNAATELAKALGAEMFDEASNILDNKQRQFALSSAGKARSKRAVDDLLGLAKSDSAIAVSLDQFDTDPEVINVANGELNLREMNLKPASRASRLTKLVDIPYLEDAKCPFWDDFLLLVMDGDTEMIDFLQRAAGYSLTGDVSERKMFVPYGEGANGKTTFLETLALLTGEYSCKISVDTLLERPAGSIPNDIARLRGARFAYASESPKEGKLNEARVKELTGGDRLLARYLFNEYFEFSPTHKLWIATNDKPVVSCEDTAIWDRLVPLPFEVRIPKEQRLPSTEVFRIIRSELPGILRWAVEGAFLWYESGLMIPSKIIAASTEYRAEMDQIGLFLATRCLFGSEAKCGATILYSAYVEHCKRVAEKPMSQRLFGSALKKRGLHSTRGGSDGSIVYHGIGINLFHDVPTVN